MSTQSTSSSVELAARKVRWLIRRFRRTIQLYGWRKTGLALDNVRAGSRVRMVPVPGHDLVLEARVGRRESDLATLGHVFAQNGYDFGVADALWVVDAGANAGYSAVWFATKFPDARIVAIEPDPGNLAVLRRNVAAWPQVVVVPSALMAFDGSAVLVDPLQGPWAMRVHDEASPWTEGAATGAVECVSLPTLFEQLAIPRVNLLKLDIEGSELDVLQAYEGWIDRVDAIVVELHDRFRPGCRAAFEAATLTFPMRRSRGEDDFAARAGASC